MHDRRHASEPLRLGPFELDLRARELRKDGQRIRLQDKPFELIATLTERPGELFTRDELRRRLWPADTFVVFDDSLNTAVNKAREALGDSAESPHFIETVPRHGYRFIAPVTGNGFAAPEDDRPGSDPARGDRGSRNTGRAHRSAAARASGCDRRIDRDRDHHRRGRGSVRHPPDATLPRRR